MEQALLEGRGGVRAGVPLPCSAPLPRHSLDRMGDAGALDRPSRFPALPFPLPRRSSNQIGDAGAAALAEGIRGLGSLQALYLQ